MQTNPNGSDSGATRRRGGTLPRDTAQRPLLGEVIIDSVWTVDLDADGLRERLDQVRVLEVRGRFAMLAGDDSYCFVSE